MLILFTVSYGENEEEINMTNKTNEQKEMLKEEKLSFAIGCLVEEESSTPIGVLNDEIKELSSRAYELEKYSECTVKDCLREIYDLTQLDTRDTDLEMTDILYLIYQELECLSDKLGIELD